ncbi:ABC transporter substrate-binding protein [Jiangella gansuensis]|uniref:ABC transporter substrate-binding protein n=1 Tax=Jiangella gansuensis TaxID=281473 RepID=UPI00146F977B|nr:ABC transporter substrate-binding protein [Jiangella gansuensis]
MLTLGAGTAACGSSDSANGRAGGRQVSGGTFTAALANPFPDLEPSVIPYVGAIVSSWFWGERLYRVDQFAPRDELIPELAVAMPEQVSPTTYRVAVRKGVTFHDGSPLTAEDVKFTFDWIRDPDTGSLWPQFLGFLGDVRVTADDEVEFDLQTPTTLLARRLVLVPIRPRSATTPFELQPIGSGPFRVVSAVSDQEIIMERFEAYNGNHGPGYDRLEFVRVADANARVAGLRSGGYAVIEDVPAAALAELDAAPGANADAVDSYVWTVLYFHCGKPPFDDVRVRQAVMYGVDREAIAQAAFFGQAVPAWAGFISPDHPEFTEPRTVHRYDPGHARRLLNDAGHGGEAIPIDVVYHSDYEFVPAQVPIIEQNLRDIGFAPAMIPMEFSAADARMVEGDYHLTINGPADWSLFAPDLEFLLRGSFTGFVTQRMVHWNGDAASKVEALLAQAIEAPNEDDRRVLLAMAQDLVQEQVPIGALFHKKQPTGWSDTTTDFRPLPTAGVAIDSVVGSG